AFTQFGFLRFRGLRLRLLVLGFGKLLGERRHLVFTELWFLARSEGGCFSSGQGRLEAQALFRWFRWRSFPPDRHSGGTGGLLRLGRRGGRSVQVGCGLEFGSRGVQRFGERWGWLVARRFPRGRSPFARSRSGRVRGRRGQGDRGDEGSW